MRTNEQLELQALARDFATAELRPKSAGWDEEGRLDDEVLSKLAESGFLGMLIPEEYGGLGFDLTTYLVVLEELAWGDAAVALSVATHNGPVADLLLRYGSDEQKTNWLPRLAAGEVLGTIGLSEPDAGSAASAVSVTATRTSSGWLLNGQTRWVTNGGRAGLVVLFARTSANELGVFLVSPTTDGYEAGDPEKKLGLRASETVCITLDGVELGEDDVLGEADGGTGYALEALDVGRIGVAAQAVGIGRAALEHATTYALEREQFGTAIARFDAVQAKLADMAQRISGGRELAFKAAAALQASNNGVRHPRTGQDGIISRAAIAKLAASEAASWSADEAIQIYGGYGYMKHYPVEKLLRDAKGSEIYEGTSEILRRVIAEEILTEAGG
jgi:alkylation response protein AidB-like acyl-CoA dehydrogenase